MLHVLPISVLLTWSLDRYLMESTEHKASCYVVFSIPFLPRPSEYQNVCETNMMEGRACTGLTWLTVGTSGGLSWNTWWTVGCCELREGSWLAEQLTSSENCYMPLFVVRRPLWAVLPLRAVLSWFAWRLRPSCRSVSTPLQCSVRSVAVLLPLPLSCVRKLFFTALVAYSHSVNVCGRGNGGCIL